METILSNIQVNFNNLISAMNEQRFDLIRFASYRTACKIRFVQKKTNLYLIDLFNAIEIIREHDLHLIQDINTEITVHQLYQLAQLMYLSLNKRLPRSQNIDITSSITNLLSFMIYANDVNQSGRINVLFVKIVFCTLSSGKFQEKLKYIFSQIIDPTSGNIMMVKFCAFLKSILQLACTVNENQFYQYDEQVAKTIFHTALLPSLDMKAFIRLFYASNGPPPILSWYVILHKIAQSEFVIHPTICSSCSQANFTGFRYKCQKCYNYNLCQNCFWQGKSTGSHNAETHSCKEYLNYKSTSKQLGNSLKRSFKLKSSPKNKIELNDDANYLKMNHNLQFDARSSPFEQIQDFDDAMSNATYDNVECSIDDTNQFEIIPNEQVYYMNDGSPQIFGNNFESPAQQYIIIEQPLGKPLNFVNDLNFELNDEHRLIAQYAASLANSNSMNSIVENYDEFGNVIHSITVDSHLNDPLNDVFLNEQLAECALAYENKNRELMMEIMRLRDFSPSSDYNSLANSVSNNCNLRTLSRFSNSPVLSVKSQQDAVALEELSFLRERKDELEHHLQALLISKEELKNQLQNTIKMSQNFQNLCSSPSSINSTLTKKDAIALKKDLTNIQQEAIKREKEFEETQELLKDELYQKSIQSHQEELDKEISKVQAEQKLLEEKELLEDFDRILKVEEVSNRLLQDKQLNNDETTSEDSVTLHDNLPDKQVNLYNQTDGLMKDLLVQRESTHLANDLSIGIESNNNTISGSIKLDNYKVDNYKTNQNETNQIELNEETMHNNIMNRNIDLLLKKNSNTTTGEQSKSNRINKYELVYGRKNNTLSQSNNSSNLINQTNQNNLSNQTRLTANQLNVPIIKRQEVGGGKENEKSVRRDMQSQVDKRNQYIDSKNRLSSSIDEISEANNSQTNSISSNTSYLRFDVKSQPLMSFQSIAYVQANRLNSNLALTNQTVSPLNKLMNLGSSNTSSDLPAYKMMGESLDDSSLDTARIQDICNLSTSTTDDELRESTKSSDTDDCPTLVDDVNASFNTSFD